MDNNLNATNTRIFKSRISDLVAKCFNQTNRRAYKDRVSLLCNFGVRNRIGNVITECGAIGINPQKQVNSEGLRSIPLLFENSVDSLSCNTA